MLRNRRLTLLLAICVTILGLSRIAAQDATPISPPTETSIPTLLPTEIPTDLPSATPLPTLTPTLLPTETPTLLPTPTANDTATETPTETPTLQASASPTETLTSTAAFTGTLTPTLTETSTETATALVTPTVSAPLPPEPPLSLTLIDSFDAPIPMFWSLNPNWAVITESGGQSLQTNTGSTLTFSTQMLPTLFEVAVELRVRFTTGVFRMNLRQSSAGDYSAELNANGQVNLYRLGQLISTTTVMPSSVGQWRTFRVSVVDNVVRVSIDGIEVTGFIDASPLAPGGLSINASGLAGDGLTIDDMKLWWYDRTQQRSQSNAAVSNRIGTNSLTAPLFTLPNPEAITYISTTTGIPNTNQLYSVYGVNTIAHPLIQGTLPYTAISSPTWSPTLPLLAYVCTDGNPPNPFPIQTVCIGKVDSALQQVAVITLGVAVNATNPRWSPDGTRLTWQESYSYSAGGYLVDTSDIYQAGIGIQNGIVQFTSPRTLFLDDNCLRTSFPFAVINSNTMDWGKNGYIYFGMNSGTASVYPEGFYRFNGLNAPTGSCPIVEKVVGSSDLAAFNASFNSGYSIDTRSRPRIKQNGDFFFGDVGGSVMLYQPTAPSNSIFKRSADNCASISLSPDETQFSCIRRFISGGLPDALFIKSNPYDNDSSNAVQLASGTSPNRDRGSTWNVPQLQVTPTLTPTPSTCNLSLTDYVTMPFFDSQNKAVLMQVFIQSHQITQGGVSRLELRRIKDYSLDPLLNNIPISDVRRYKLIQVPGWFNEPYSINNVTINSDNISIAQPGWFVTSYGVTDPQCSGLNVAQINTGDFSFEPTVPIVNLYNLTVDNRLDNGNGILVSPPIDTSIEFGFINPYINGLAEYQTNIQVCSLTDPNCFNRIYNRMVLDVNNRFDDQIIDSAQQHGTPPLLLKVLLMQESSLVPAFTANAAGAAGIAQFTAAGGAAQMVIDGRAPQNITTGAQYRDSIDGITSNCVLRSAPGTSGQYPVSELNCVDFKETLQAIDDAAYFLKWSYNYLSNLVTDPRGILSTAWQNTPSADRQSALWLYSAASYNFGPGSVTSALKLAAANNQSLTLQTVCPYLASETQRYVKNIRNGTPGAASNGTCG